jgi:hypothetical protein
MYVDDRIIASSAGNCIVDIKTAFGSIFSMQDLRTVSWLLGMTVEQDRIINIGQRQYVLDMLERFNVVDGKPLESLMSVTTLNVCAGIMSSFMLSLGSVPYQSLIGSLLYASASKRSYITMAVSHLRKHMAIPTQSQ